MYVYVYSKYNHIHKWINPHNVVKPTEYCPSPTPRCYGLWHWVSRMNLYWFQNGFNPSQKLQMEKADKS